jgi:hypothetical protein
MEATRRDALGIFAASGVVLNAMAAVPAQAAEPSAPDQNGWRSLFNGKNLDGWTFFQDGIGNQDRDGVIDFRNGSMHILGPTYHGPTTPKMGYVATVEEFSNYHLSLEYRWGPRRYDPRTQWKRDSGLLYHAPAGDLLWPDSIEYQIMERSTGDAFPINHRAVAGISMGGVPAWPHNPPGLPYAPQINAGHNLRQAIRADGSFDSLDDWNTIELIAEGANAAHLVNGRIVNTLYNLEAQDPANRSNYRPVSSGRILLQIECAEIEFRNIKIKHL